MLVVRIIVGQIALIAHGIDDHQPYREQSQDESGHISHKHDIGGAHSQINGNEDGLARRRDYQLAPSDPTGPRHLGEEGTCNGDAEQIGKAEEVLHLRALESRTEQEHILEK